MGRYLAESTISQSYERLSISDFPYPRELFYLLLLKHAGLTQHSYLNLADEDVKERLFEAGKNLASISANPDTFNQKYSFINPLHMSSWGNEPTESLQKWSRTRLINNVVGGGTQWKMLLSSSQDDPMQVKLRHDYLSFFEGANSKISIVVLACWFHRFVKFDVEMPASILIKSFSDFFNITREERQYFFTDKVEVHPSYNDSPITTEFIRTLIGNPAGQAGWTVEIEDSDQHFIFSGGTAFSATSKFFGAQPNQDELLDILHKSNQAIFMGPPGTSKSFAAKNLSILYSHVRRIQFHPQYSYQDFVKGKVLSEGSLEVRKGALVEFLDLALKADEGRTEETFLLVIEEINRANVSQVFGELIQLLDRNESLELDFGDQSILYRLPSNFQIVGTMNTTDRTVGRIDFAIKRRFYQIYFGVDYDLLIDKVFMRDNVFSVPDFLKKINDNSASILNNREMILGHALFLKDFAFSSIDDCWIWDVEDFSTLFNFSLLPIIDDYCNGNPDLLRGIVGEDLQGNLVGEEFLEAVLRFLS